MTTFSKKVSLVFRVVMANFTEKKCVDSLSTPYLTLGSDITSHSEICVFCHKMACRWRFVILLVLLVILQIGFAVRRYLNNRSGQRFTEARGWNNSDNCSRKDWGEL